MESPCLRVNFTKSSYLSTFLSKHFNNSVVLLGNEQEIKIKIYPLIRLTRRFLMQKNRPKISPSAQNELKNNKIKIRGEFFFVFAKKKMFARSQHLFIFLCMNSAFAYFLLPRKRILISAEKAFLTESCRGLKEGGESATNGRYYGKRIKMQMQRFTRPISPRKKFFFPEFHP